MGLKPPSDLEPRKGLASLLHDTGRQGGIVTPGHSRDFDPCAAVAYVIDEPNVASFLNPEGKFVDFSAVSNVLEARMQSFHEEATPATDSAIGETSEDIDASSGRIGPPDVVMTEARGSVQIDNHAVSSLENFCSVKANAAVIKGKWMYEVQLGSSGILQIGWTAPGARFTAEEGIGDSPDSFAYDGKRQRKWNVTATPYGARWVAGDIISCAIDLDLGTISYWQNGKSLGIAFRDIRRRSSGAAYFAGISMSHAERCEVNFGDRPFVYPQAGYLPLQAPPAPSAVAAATYISACWERLLDATTQRPSGADSPGSAAAIAATRASPSPFQRSTRATEGNRMNIEAGTSPMEGGQSRWGGSMLGAAFIGSDLEMEYVHAKSPEGPLTLLNPGPPIDSSKGVSTGEPSLSGPDALLLALMLAPHTGRLCMSPYFVKSTMLPLLRKAAKSHIETRCIDRLLRLLCCALEPVELTSLTSLVCDALGREVRCCSWDPRDFPESTASEALALWERCLRCEEWTAAWTAGPKWMEGMESLLCVRHPPAAELASVLPNLQWRRGEDFATVLAGSTGDGMFVSDLEGLGSAINRVENIHASLFAALCCAPANRQVTMAGEVWAAAGCEEGKPRPQLGDLLRQYTGSSGQPSPSVSLERGGALQDEEEEGLGIGEEERAERFEATTETLNSALWEWEGVPVPHALRCFLDHLAEKNRGADRNVPPPGLSDGTVLVSTFFALLRMLKPWLDRVHVQGGAFVFPSAPFLHQLEGLMQLSQRGRGAAAGPRYRDVPRLGGTLSHLLKVELPLKDAKQEMGPIEVPAGPHRGPGWQTAMASIPLEFSPAACGALSPYGVVWGYPQSDDDGQERKNAGGEGRRTSLEPRASSFEWWITDRLLSLYSLGVASRVRLGFTHLQALEQGLTSLQQMIARGDDERSSGARELLRLSIVECKKTVTESLRQHGWHSVWLMTSWKQELGLGMASTVARLVTACAEREGPLLAFVPEHYIEVMLDLVHSVRRSEARPWPDIPAFDAFGLGDVLSCVVQLANDSRIVSPEARGMLIQSLWALLNEDECLAIICRNQKAEARMMPALIRLLADDRTWVQVANTLGLLVIDYGFGHIIRHPLPVEAEPADAAAAEAAADLASSHRAVVRGWLTTALRSDASLSGIFFNALFDHINWTVTELVVALEELSNRNRDRRTSAHLQRRCAATADLCEMLLRLAEYTCESAPEQILGRGRGLSATRLAEIIAFGLRQFAIKGKLDKIAKKEGIAPRRTRPANDRRLRSTLAAEMLTIYIGILWALTIATPDGDGHPPRMLPEHCEQELAHRSLVSALCAQGLPRDVYTNAMEGVAAHLEADLIQAEGMSVRGAGEQRLVDPLHRFRLYAETGVEWWESLMDCAEEFGGQILRRFDDGESAEEGAEGGSEGEEDEEPPSQFVDPIMHTVMDEPVVLPDSGMTIDRATIERHLLSSATDPFTRAPLSAENLKEDEALRLRIRAWVESRKDRRRTRRRRAYTDDEEMCDP